MISSEKYLPDSPREVLPMLRFFLGNDKTLFAALGANGALEWCRRALLSHQADLTVWLTIAQLFLAVATIIHLIAKWLKAYELRAKQRLAVAAEQAKAVLAEAAQQAKQDLKNE